MKKLVGLVSLLAAMIATGTMAATREEKALAALRALTPEHFKSKVTLSDSNLDVSATLHTREGFRASRGFWDSSVSDVLLRAWIDKKSGRSAIQVYGNVEYTGDWHFFTTANYTAFGTPEQVSLDSIARDVLNCRSDGCTLSEAFGFNIPEAYLRKLVATNDPQNTKIWLMRFNAKDGTQINQGLTGNEIAGLLSAMDDYRAKNNLPAWKPEETPAE